jgi:Zn-dependent peptidase ImmA (M78 family)
MDGKNPEKDATEILTTYWAREDGTIAIPVDPIAIAHKLGIKVLKAPLAPDVSGTFFMSPGKDPEIYLNQSDSYNRQRFTCAHELGHWAKHTAEGVESEQLVDYRSSLSSTGRDPVERYANQFAAALLMPVQEVLRLKDRGYGPVAVADALRVSVDAANFRVENLGAY